MAASLPPPPTSIYSSNDALRTAMSIAAILGSAFSESPPGDLELEPVSVETAWGEQTLHRVDRLGRDAYVCFRHGRPHERLPNQIPYRAQTAALDEVGVESLLVTSSVGVMDPDLPLAEPLLVEDLLTMDNRLPDGSACTMFEEPSDDHGHLVLQDGLLSSDLDDQIRDLAEAEGHPVADTAVFGYVGGPRGKTKAENRMWSRLGAQINSMTVAPEVSLANELEIACSALAVGHKYSLPDETSMEGEEAVEASLRSTRAPIEAVATAFLTRGEPVEFGNHLYRFD